MEQTKDTMKKKGHNAIGQSKQEKQNPCGKYKKTKKKIVIHFMCIC